MSKKWTYIILSAFFLLLVAIQFVQYADYDLWWHLSLGKSIADNGHIYDVDEFSYTYAGKPQYTGDWLADLLIYFSSLPGGLLSMNIMKAMIVGMAFMFMYLMLSNYIGNDMPAFMAKILIMILALFAIRFRLFIRPYLFGYAFFSYFLYAFSCYETRGDKRPLYWLPLLQTAWSNMSIGSLFGPLAAIFFLAGAVAKKAPRGNIKLIAILTGVIIICSLVSPVTYTPYAMQFSFMSDVVQDKIPAISGEYQPVTLSLLFGHGFKYTFAYQGLILLSIFYFIFMKGWRNLYIVLLFAVFLVESATHVRMVDYFTFIAVIAAAHPAKWVMTRLLEKGRIASYAPGALALIVLAIIPAAVFADPTYTPGTGIKKNTFPDMALAFLEREGISGRMFNSYGFGGYIIHHSPERKVFIDGRQAHLYDNEFDYSYSAAISNASVFEDLDQKWGFDYTILEYNDKTRSFPLHLNENPRWALVYWDRSSAVYLKRSERNRNVIAMYEFIFAKPSFYSFDNVISFWKKRGLDPEAIPIMDREITMSPLNQEIRISKASYLHQLGPQYYQEAFREVLAALAMEPDIAIEHSFAAVFLGLMGKGEESKAEIEKALRLDPNESIALGLKQSVMNYRGR